jgi:phage gp29-like protein
MATSKTAITKAAAAAPGASSPELNTEVANRLRDPFENLFNGLVRTNDPLLLERGQAGNNYELYKDLKRDGKVFSGLQKRKLALISRPWKVDPVEDGPQGQKDAEIVQAMLKRLMFDKVCSELLDALILGFVPAEVVWTERDNMIVPKRIVKRAQRRFVYVQTDPNAAPELRLLTAQNMLTGEALPQRKFVVHRVNPEDDNPYGTGLGLQLYWPVFFKRKGILSWNKLNDRFGSPTPWGKYPNGAGAKEKGTLFDALKAMSNDGVLMTPDGMSIELLESKLTGSISTQKDLCAYMDNWISEVILSQESTSRTGATGAAANEREDVRLDLVQADADLLSDTLNSTLIEWICEFNGLTPCTVSRVIKKPEDLLSASQTDVNIASLGFKPTLESIRARYGEGWDVAPPPAPAPANHFPGIGNMVGSAPGTPGAPPQAKPTSFAEAPLDQTDAIDALIEAELAQWQPLVTPAASALQAAIDQSIASGETAAQLIAKLPQLLADLPVDALAQSLTRAAFTARLAGAAGISTV